MSANSNLTHDSRMTGQETRGVETWAAAKLAARPRTLADTGLSETFLCNLLAKHLYEAGVLNLHQLSERTALAGTILEELLNQMRAEAWIEIRRSDGTGGGLRYALTDRGRVVALDAMAVSGYTGPAPVPLEDYTRVVKAQSVHRSVITRQAVQTAFTGVVIDPKLLDQLGPALHSGRAIFIYGSPGTGKTFISRRLAGLLGGRVLIPHAIAAGDTVVQLFDPLLHQSLEGTAPARSLLLEEGHDPRFTLCQRPVIITGGELTLDELEMRYDATSNQYHAPLQLKASNGMFLIDDLGRQRVATVDLLNRWIVPMEERKDFFNLGSGKHFEVPFDMVLIFSTNLNPLDLADAAFLRRIGHKIRFHDLNALEYEQIWRQVCAEREIPFDEEVIRYVLEGLHGKNKVPLLPCHPRDLLGLAHDQCLYEGTGDRVTIERIRWAWENYFIQLS
jgi:predicted ATPase with chaperone activity